jgi:hypothetical protein
MKTLSVPDELFLSDKIMDGQTERHKSLIFHFLANWLLDVNET